MTKFPATRLADCCSEAMFGYAEATTAFWWSAAQQTVDACDRAIKAASPGAEAEPTSWFNPAPGGKAFHDSVEDTMPWPQMSWFGAEASIPQPFAWGGAAMPAVSPFDVWFNMFPLSANPVAWPMAYFMLSAGVPKDVAWPTAKANAAMMEAAELATGQVQSAFSSYRSDSGYASAANFNANFNGWSGMFSSAPYTYWTQSA